MNDELSSSDKTHESSVKKQIKVIVEKHTDGYVAYPIGLKGVVVAQGDSYQEGLDEIKSAIDFHIRLLGKRSLIARMLQQRSLLLKH